MKKVVYNYPTSSFLSVEKDMGLIVSQMLKNNRLKNMLYYTTKDCLDKADLTEDESLDLFGKNIKIVPKLQIDGEVLNYIIISFDKFIPNATNPEFRDNLIQFGIICHFNQWNLKDFALRPYKIAAEIDSMFNEQHLTGIGKLEFLRASQMLINEEFGGLSLTYKAVHGEEDKINAPNPMDNISLQSNFNEMYN